MPQVLITGGAGFIGSHIADHLEPEVAFAEGLEELVAWLASSTRSIGSMRRPRSWRVGGWSYE